MTKMIANFCQRVQKLTGKNISFHALSRGVFRYSVKIAEVKPFLARLSKNNLELFEKQATFSLGDQRRDKRSAVIPLENPLNIEGKTIFALRLKGVFPQVSENGKAKRYTKGRGFSPRLLEPAGGTAIIAKSERPASEYSAWGAMSFETLEREVETALILGPERTDLLLGFGMYEDFSFNGKPVGFAIYGMERKEDIRIKRHLWSHIEEKGSFPKVKDLAEHTGKLLREMHELKLGHQFPHLGNYGFLSQKEARLLDLETSFELLSVSQEARLAFLYLDLSHTTYEYQRIPEYKNTSDGETIKEDFPLTPLLPFFFWGYFQGDTSLSFIKVLQRFMDGNYKPYELSDIFGRLPEFKEGWRRGGEFTLIEPIIKLYTLPEDSQIDLEDFRSYPFFNLFYEALESVALSI
ncbi:MAG: hypothetical protein V3T21_06485 [Candidatus Margulisiibacteriota bacterium]